jgi:dGTPase
LVAVRSGGVQVIGPAPSMREAKEVLEAWLFKHLYRHHLVNRTFHRARRRLRELFGFYIEHPDTLPPDHAARAEHEGLHVAVSDYLAGMTDRFADEEHRRLLG